MSYTCLSLQVSGLARVDPNPSCECFHHCECTLLAYAHNAAIRLIHSYRRCDCVDLRCVHYHEEYQYCEGAIYQADLIYPAVNPPFELVTAARLEQAALDAELARDRTRREERIARDLFEIEAEWKDIESRAAMASSARHEITLNQDTWSRLHSNTKAINSTAVHQSSPTSPRQLPSSPSPSSSSSSSQFSPQTPTDAAFVDCPFSSSAGDKETQGSRFSTSSCRRILPSIRRNAPFAGLMTPPNSNPTRGPLAATSRPSIVAQNEESVYVPLTRTIGSRGRKRSYYADIQLIEACSFANLEGCPELFRCDDDGQQ